jgi:hypothetical protein
MSIYMDKYLLEIEALSQLFIISYSLYAIPSATMFIIVVYSRIKINRVVFLFYITYYYEMSYETNKMEKVGIGFDSIPARHAYQHRNYIRRKR